MAVHHVRRYLTPIGHPFVDAEGEEPEFDAMMEMWFKDQAQFDEAMKAFADPVLSKAIREDEPNLFDVSKIRHFLVDEEVPDLGNRSEEHTSELQSLMRISYAVFCLKKKST